MIFTVAARFLPCPCPVLENLCNVDTSIDS
jgi:hypothetical protein